MKSIIVSQYMTTNLVTLKSDMNVYYAIGLLLKNNISGAPVIDDNSHLVGILSEKDCLRIFTDTSLQNIPVSETILLGRGTVDQFMSKNVCTVDASTDLFTVADLFLKNNFRRFPVLKEKKIVGQISRRDVLKAIKDITNYDLDSNETS